VIRNADGTPYKLGELRSFDPTSPDNELLNEWDAEIIKINGSPLYYYEVFISPAVIDKDYHEARGKVWSQHPTELFGMYEPIASLNDLGSFGIDSPDEIVFELNYKAVLDALGHPPVIGSRIFTPHLREHWELVQNSTGDYKNWNVLRLQMTCKRFQESLTTGEGRVTQTTPKIKII